MRDSNKYRRWLVEQCECSPDYFGGDIILRDNKRKCNYTGCSRKNAVWHDKFWTIRCKICFLHHNVRQRLLSNSRRKICVNGLIYSLLNIQVITHWQWSRLHVNIEHSGLPVDKCFPDFIQPSNWPPNSPDLNPVDYSLGSALQCWCIIRR